VQPTRVALTVEQLWQRVPGGSGSYVRELVRELALRDDVAVTGLAARLAGGAGGEELPVPVARSPLPRQALYPAWNRLRRPRAERVTGPVDVVHATTWAVPGTRAPLVVTVHDLAFLDEPEHFTPRGNAFFRRALEIVAHEAARVVVPSRATAEACAAHGLDPARTVVVPHGVRTDPGAAGRVGAWRRAQGVDRPYLLWCGTLEPRKNVEGLLAAFVDVAAADPDLDLVLVGPDGWGATAERVRAAVDAAGPGRVHLAGRLSDRDLQTAYAGARAFAFPSIREGFGMPVLEAMAHGVPVVTSAGTPMAELVGAGGRVVDPLDRDALAGALTEVAGPGRDRFAAGAVAAAAGRTWAAAAAAHVAVYREAAATR
jgi:glycosyltransferase involved in cell wall biosynthesis